MNKKILTISVVLALLFSSGIVRSTGNYFLYFDGINDVVDFGNNASLNLDDKDFIVEFLIKNDDVRDRDILGTFWDWGFGIYTASDFFGTYGCDVDCINDWQIEGDILANNDWQKIKLVRVGNNFELFVDDISAGTSTDPVGNITEPTRTLKLGGNIWLNASPSDYWKGYVDWLKIWKDSVLVGSWDFNEGSGVVAYDTSGYDNHGSITGAEFIPETPEVEANFFNLTSEMTGNTLAYTGELFTDLAPALVFILGLPLALNYVLPKLIKLMTKNPK